MHETNVGMKVKMSTRGHSALFDQKIHALADYLHDLDLSPNAIEVKRRTLPPGSYIDLTSNNPTTQELLFPHRHLRQAADTFWEQRVYEPDARGMKTARVAIEKYYREKRSEESLRAEDIFITASTSEAYSLLFSLLTNPGDNVLVADVSYPLFEHLAALHRVELRPYHLDEHQGWAIDQASLKWDERTRAVLVVSPHNPTGAIVREALRIPVDMPVICDEVFAECVFQKDAAPCFSTLMPNSPVFLLNGISKMFALPDFKLGWIAMNAIAADFYSPFLELLNDTLLGANVLTQHMLTDIFSFGEEFSRKIRERVQRNAELALSLFQTCSSITAEMPNGAYTLFPRIHWAKGDEDFVLHLLSQGVFVHPGFFYGYDSGCRIAISCLTEPKSFRLGLERIIRALS
jgi:alanine-synthesizing transaminase